MASSGKPQDKKAIIAGLTALMGEQRDLATKINELETDLVEHKVVLSTLNECEGDRKCFRLINGVLCERTVKDVVPVLGDTIEMISQTLVMLNEELIKKSQEIDDFKDKHEIVMRDKNGMVIGPAAKKQED